MNRRKFIKDLMVVSTIGTLTPAACLRAESGKPCNPYDSYMLFGSCLLMI